MCWTLREMTSGGREKGKAIALCPRERHKGLPLSRAAMGVVVAAAAEVAERIRAPPRPKRIARSARTSLWRRGGRCVCCPRRRTSTRASTESSSTGAATRRGTITWRSRRHKGRVPVAVMPVEAEAVAVAVAVRAPLVEAEEAEGGGAVEEVGAVAGGEAEGAGMTKRDPPPPPAAVATRRKGRKRRMRVRAMRPSAIAPRAPVEARWAPPARARFALVDVEERPTRVAARAVVLSLRI